MDRTWPIPPAEETVAPGSENAGTEMQNALLIDQSACAFLVDVIPTTRVRD